jgi:hypothetical protein
MKVPHKYMQQSKSGSVVRINLDCIPLSCGESTATLRRIAVFEFSIHNRRQTV